MEKLQAQCAEQARQLETLRASEAVPAAPVAMETDETTGPLAYNPATTKILRLRENPVKWAFEARARELESLRETAALSRTGLNLSGNTTATELDLSTGPRPPSTGGDSPNPLDMARELAKARERLEGAEKRTERLKQVWSVCALAAVVRCVRD